MFNFLAGLPSTPAPAAKDRYLSDIDPTYSADLIETIPRPDQSTIAQAGGFYGGTGGNTVNPDAIVKTMNVLDGSRKTATSPLGTSASNGY